MLSNFRSYQLAISFYRSSKEMKLSSTFRDQWARASSSIAMNLAEGYGKITPKDRARFYRIALGSLRECQCMLKLIDDKQPALSSMADHLGGSIYKLIRATN